MMLMVCGDLGRGGASAPAPPTGAIASGAITAAAANLAKIPMTPSLKVVILSYMHLSDRVSASVATGLGTVSADHNALACRDRSVIPAQSPAPIASGVAIQAPPTSGTLGSVRYSAAFSRSTCATSPQSH